MHKSTLLINILTVIFWCTLTHSEVQAQQWLGISGSNYAGTNSVYNNPANITDSRYKCYVNLSANDIFIANNYVGYNAPFSMFKLLTNTAAAEYRNSKNVILFKTSYYDINVEGEGYQLNALNDLRGPAFLFTINDKRSIGLLSRMRTLVNLNGVSLPLANLIRLGTDTLLLKNQNFNISNIALNINSYAEFGISYGQILWEEEEDFLKIGINLKRVVGIYNAHLNIEQADYTINNDPAEPKKQTLKIDKLKAEYGYTSEASFNNAKLSLPWIFGNQSAGSGWGVDVGIIYEYRPENRKFTYRQKGVQKLDPSKNKYKYKIGFSILDLGGISYNNPFYVSNWKVDINNKTFNSDDVSQVKGLDDAFKRINQVVDLRNDQRVNGFSVGLPTSFQMNLDYHLKNHLYVNSLWVQGLRGSNSISMKVPSSLSITPRWEGKWIEVGIPLALLNNYNSFIFGVGARIGPLFLGTDNLGSFLNLNRPRGTDVYVGLYVPIFSRPPILPTACSYDKVEPKKWKFWKKNN